MTNLLIFLFLNPLLLSPLMSVCSGSDIKRLLLNDQTVMADRLAKLEQVVAVLNLTLIQQQTENNLLKSKVQTLESSLTKQTGSTYIRWGRHHCVNNNRTEEIYSGFAAGGHYSESGSGAEYVCLPPNPDFVKTAGDRLSAHIYGAEYDSENFFKSNSMDEDVPCALCRSLHTSSSIMIPGKNVCHDGWKQEYHGYLSAADYRQTAQSSFACIDINPEYIFGGVENHQGKLFNSVIAKCGSLKCPPYINNYPLTCVVCSK